VKSKGYRQVHERLHMTRGSFPKIQLSRELMRFWHQIERPTGASHPRPSGSSHLAGGRSKTQFRWLLPDQFADVIDVDLGGTFGRGEFLSETGPGRRKWGALINIPVMPSTALFAAR
jgi:hypothetical protein